MNTTRQTHSNLDHKIHHSHVTKEGGGGIALLVYCKYQARPGYKARVHGIMYAGDIVIKSILVASFIHTN